MAAVRRTARRPEPPPSCTQRSVTSRIALAPSRDKLGIELREPEGALIDSAADDPRWPTDRIVAESRTGIEHGVDVKRPLMVHVLYWTAWVDTDGDLHFAPDIYARDPALDRAMRKRPPKF